MSCGCGKKKMPSEKTEDKPLANNSHHHHPDHHHPHHHHPRHHHPHHHHPCHHQPHHHHPHHHHPHHHCNSHNHCKPLEIRFESGRMGKCGENKIKLRGVSECDADKILNCIISKSEIHLNCHHIPLSITEIDYYPNGSFLCVSFENCLSCENKYLLNSFNSGELVLWCN